MRHFNAYINEFLVNHHTQKQEQEIDYYNDISDIQREFGEYFTTAQWGRKLFGDRSIYKRSHTFFHWVVIWNYLYHNPQKTEEEISIALGKIDFIDGKLEDMLNNKMIYKDTSHQPPKYSIQDPSLWLR